MKRSIRWIGVYILLLSFAWVIGSTYQTDTIDTMGDTIRMLDDEMMYQQEKSKKLRILFITDVFPHPGRQYINNQITGFIDLGHHVYILAKEQGTYPEDPMIAQYNLHDKIFYQTLPQEMRAFDILYCQFGEMGDYCLDLMKKIGLTGKMVVCFRGGDATRALRQNAHRFDKVFKKARYILAVCNYFRDRLILCGARKDRTVVHHSAIDCDKIKFIPRRMPEDKIVRFVTVGRLVEMKGIEYAIRAIARVHEKYPHVYYEVIGDGGLYNSLNNLIGELGAHEYIKLIGYMPHDSVVQKLNTFHISLVPSCTTNNWNQEGIPNAAMEAMAGGLPVIGTIHSGLPELVKNGVSGFLVPEKDVAALEEKIMYLINRSYLWEAMGMAGRAHVLKEHNKKIANHRVIQLFKSIL